MKINAYLNSELPSNNLGAKRAQIVLSSADETGHTVDAIEFEKFDDAMGISYGVRVTWQLAGAYARHAHHRVSHAYLAKQGGKEMRFWSEKLTSRRLTESGEPRYRSLHPQLLAVYIEDEEVDALWARLNAVAYDERQEVLRDFAREVTGLSLGDSVRVR